MRILYVCADMGISPYGDGGAASHVRAITGALAARGHQVTLACRRTDGRTALPAGVTVAVMPEDQRQHTVWLGHHLRTVGADAVVERYSLSSGPATEAARRFRAPFILEVNAPLVDEIVRLQGLEGADAWRRWEGRMLAGADHVVAVSAAVAQHAVACGARPDRVAVVPNGADPARFAGASGRSVRLRHGLLDAFVVGFCGTLRPWQGALDLVEALPMLAPQVRLLIVGDGPDRGAIRFRSISLGVQDRVVLTGAVHERDVPAHLAAMDVGAAPYHVDAGAYLSPLKTAEYCAAGLPVVTSDAGEASALGGAAMLVPPQYPAALAAALGMLAEHPERRALMSRAARAAAAGRTWDAAARRILSLVAANSVELQGERGAVQRAAWG